MPPKPTKRHPGRPLEPLRPKTPKQRLGANLRARRLALGLRPQDLAEAIGLSDHRGWTRWERGQTSPAALQLRQIARLLRCTVDDLLP